MKGAVLSAEDVLRGFVFGENGINDELAFIPHGVKMAYSFNEIADRCV